LLLTLAGGAVAQSNPGSFTTIKQLSFGHAIFDRSGNTYYLQGRPTAGAAQTQSGGGTCFTPTGITGSVPGPCTDVEVIKLDGSGKQVWGTLLGGPTADKGTALAIDAAGNVLITGLTAGQFPTTRGAAIESSTTPGIVVAKISADGSKFLYATYLPAGLSTSSSIAVDERGNAYIAGQTTQGHAFALKLSADGSTVAYNVTLAGSGTETATTIAVDPAGEAFVAGQTTSRDFPVTVGAYQQGLRGTQNAFLVRLDPAGRLLTGTYLGGSGTDSPTSIALDAAGNIDLAGSTSSLDFPTAQGTMQPSAIVPLWNNAAPAGFVAQLARDSMSLHWATYVMSSDLRQQGGSNGDVGVTSVAVSSTGEIYVTGLTGPGFPVTTSAPAICFQGAANRTNGFLAHLNSKGALLDATYLGSSNVGDIYVAGGVLPLSNSAALVAWQENGDGIVSRVQFGTGDWTAPACLSTNILNAATQSGGGLASGELVSLTGFGIGPDAGIPYQPDAQDRVPTQLAGVQVLFDGVPVPLLYVQSRQINAIAPAGLTVDGKTSITVIYNNQQFGPAVAPTTFGSPGVFRLQLGQSSQAAAINQDGTINGPANPAARGSVVTLWGTGYGQTDPPCLTGGFNVASAAPLGVGISAQIYGAAPGVFGPILSLTTLQYAGSAPGLLCGVTQINFQVPSSISPGAFSFLPWITLIRGNTTRQYQPPIGATISVK
jgi:uncharacterized protein (TIGR03437 family)